jgi:hypothetical protein
MFFNMTIVVSGTATVVSTLVLTDVQLFDSGEYLCRASNYLMSSAENFTGETTDTFNITVISKFVQYDPPPNDPSLLTPSPNDPSLLTPSFPLR